MIRCRIWLVWLSTLTLAGCGGGEQEIPLSVTADNAADNAARQPASPNSSPGATAPGATAPTVSAPAAVATVSQASQNVLLGNWQGGMVLDQARASELYDEQQLKVIQSMTMEIEFAANGELAMRAVLQTPEGPSETSSVGTWEVVKQQGNRYTIRSKEADGEPEEIEVALEDRNTILLAAPDDVGVFRLTRK